MSKRLHVRWEYLPKTLVTKDANLQGRVVHRIAYIKYLLYYVCSEQLFPTISLKGHKLCEKWMFIQSLDFLISQESCPPYSNLPFPSNTPSPLSATLSPATPSSPIISPLPSTLLSPFPLHIPSLRLLPSLHLPPPLSTYLRPPLCPPSPSSSGYLRLLASIHHANTPTHGKSVWAALLVGLKVFCWLGL